VTQTGCVGVCEKEPIVQVILGTNPKISYGKVTPEVAKQIIKDHVVNGKVVEKNVIQL
jgi:NADP-reducing hydrogenase subunit HndB